MFAAAGILLLVVSTVLARPTVEVGFVAGQSPLAMVPVPDNNTRVPILLGVMSRCPDALMCESLFDGALPKVWDIVDINLSFIGTIDPANKEYGVNCMHGPEECAGNVQELCAISRAQSQEQWWHFLNCVNYEGRNSVGDQALAERCAGMANIPWDDNGDTASKKGMKSCVEGEEGKALLQTSVKNSKALGITRSCTIMVSGKQRCVRDGTWKDCETGHTSEELVGYIQEEYQRLTSNESSDAQ